MDRDDELEPTPREWEDVRDEERGMEGGYTSGPNVGAPGRPSRAPRGYRRPDERIREDVYDRLCGRTGADASDVSVEVCEGEVALIGSVPEQEDARRITELAARVPGVKGVINRLEVLAPAG